MTENDIIKKSFKGIQGKEEDDAGRLSFKDRSK